MLMYILQGVAYGFSGAVQPGPFQTYVISEALRKGWRRTLPAALSPLVSDGPIIALAVLLLSRLPTGWDRILYIVGGGFVMTLAWSAFRAWRDFDLTQPLPDREVEATGLLKAALMNALSPGPYLYWGLVTGPILLTAWREKPSHGIGFLVGFYGALVGGLVSIIVLFGAARRLGPRVTRWMVGFSAVALAAFGLYQVWQGVVSG
jgi:threonine/homoserine/homoserine lactone efflux protein